VAAQRLDDLAQLGGTTGSWAFRPPKWSWTTSRSRSNIPPPELDLARTAMRDTVAARDLSRVMMRLQPAVEARARAERHVHVQRERPRDRVAVGLARGLAQRALVERTLREVRGRRV
jgi:hypothetical protein